MDDQRFDRLAHAVGAGASRRQIVRLFGAFAAYAFGARRPVAAQATCAAGQTDCGGVCVDTCCNNNHCGACGNACPPGLTCFEGVCDCPSGDCPPVEPPHTGAGPGDAAAGQGPWLALALASAAAGIAARWRTHRQT